MQSKKLQRNYHVNVNLNAIEYGALLRALPPSSAPFSTLVRDILLSSITPWLEPATVSAPVAVSEAPEKLSSLDRQAQGSARLKAALTADDRTAIEEASKRASERSRARR